MTDFASRTRRKGQGAAGDHPPSQADVAELAGVSTQTVSRVVNNRPNVEPDTRERVLSAMRVLGYLGPTPPPARSPPAGSAPSA